MSTSKYIEQVVSAIIKSAHEKTEILELIDEIRHVEKAFNTSKKQLTKIQENISLWDRILFFIDTDEEESEKDLSEDVKSFYFQLKNLLSQLDSMILEIVDTMAETDSNLFRARLLYIVQPLKIQIDELEIDHGVLGWSDIINETEDIIRGKRKCITMVTQLEKAISSSLDMSISFKHILQTVKKELLE